jgi:hypothetical protein
MSVKAFNINQTREYCLKGDPAHKFEIGQGTGCLKCKKPEDAAPHHESPTTFTLGVLDSALSTHLLDKLVGYRKNDKGPEDRADTVVLNKFTRDREIVKYGLKGWSGFMDAVNDHAVEFDPKLHQKSYALPFGNRNGLSDKALDLLKPFLSELAEEIESDNIVTEQDAKNSDGLSTEP